MKLDEVAELKKIIYSTMDFCGKPMEAAKQFCKENGIAWDRDAQSLAVHFIGMYPK